MRVTTLDDLCAVVGYTATRIIAAWFPGRQLYVPQRAYPGHPLALLIGYSALQALVAEYAVEKFDIPHPDYDDRFRRDRRVAEMLVAGLTAGEIADQLGTSTRFVERRRADLVERGWLEWAAAAGPGRRRHRGVENRLLLVEVGTDAGPSPGEIPERAGSHAT